MYDLSYYQNLEKSPKPNWLISAENSPLSNIRVLNRELDERYKPGAVIDSKTFFMNTDLQGNVILPAKKILSFESKRSKYLQKSLLIANCVERNNKGTELEKAGKISEAIALYEENIKPGCYPALHSFDRLLVIYRRNKDYKNELRVCKRAISVFKTMEKYKTRLEKIEALMKK